MSYRALYRVWRPQRFSDLVGQELVTKTLKNAIITHQTSHAYLFTGPRGTGKTSAAKIFAKAINCKNQQDGEPCNHCEICKAITKGTLNDVIEIDAASNNGVEEIREIRDKAKYAPTMADYKVYIIDEVHMLSTGAFNALLKTLEEPPKNVVFILATTEPHKIPLTIISRTQRFDFRRITPKVIFDRMEYILKSLKIDYDVNALKVIAKSADGGMRDALSILDQVISFGEDEVTFDNALLVTGSTTKENLTNYLNEVIEGNISKALKTLHEILNEGKDAQRLIEDLIAYCRDILLYKEAPDMVDEIELDTLSDSFRDYFEDVKVNTIYKMILLLNEQQENMRYAIHQSVYLEVLTVKLAQIKGESKQDFKEESIKKLKYEIKQLKQKINGLQNNVVIQEEKPKVVEKQVKYKVELDKVYSILNTATKQDLLQLRGVWDSFIEEISSMAAKAIFQTALPVAAGPKGALITLSHEFLCEKVENDSKLKLDATTNLSRIMKQEVKLVYIPKNNWRDIRKNYLQSNKSNKGSKNKKEDTSSVVEKAENLFGKQLVEIRED